MSIQITEAFVQQYSANVFHLSQQKGSRLRAAVRNESQVGKAAFYDRIGSVSAVKKVGRHSPTPQLDTPHSRRRVTLEDYEWADLIDSQDKIRMLQDPQSEYVIAAMWAMGRAMDDEIILAALGNAYAGETGSTVVVHPNSQKYAANNGTSFTNLNVRTLRAVKRIMDEQEVDPSEKRYLVCSAKQIDSLLGQTEVTSSDFNSVKALVQGEVNTFMGFEFIRIERLATVASGAAWATASPTTGAVGSGSSTVGFRRAFAFSMPALLLAIGQDMVSRIGERADKSYSMQVYAMMSIGATRMEEAKVVEIQCNEA
jgi:hypothetical protein